jgi:signal transduction histidine kinase
MGRIADQEVEQSSISVRRALAIALALMAAVGLIALTILVSNSNKQRDEALAAQRQSFEVIILTRSLQSTMARAELSLGRYVVNFEPEFGRIYVDEWRRAGFAIDRLQQVTRDNPRQAQLAARVRRIYDERGSLLSDAALRTRYKQDVNGLAVFDRAGRVANVRELNATIERIIALENRLLDQRISAANATLDQSNWAATLLLSFAVVILVGAGLLGFSMIQSMVERRALRKDTDEVMLRALELEDAVAERTAELRRANEALLAEAAEREAAEAQLRQVQKMEAVGKLTGGIAHDFNNLLQVILGYVDIIGARVGDDRRLTAAVEAIGSAATRGATLTQQLLAFARKQELRDRLLNFNSLVADFRPILTRSAGDNIDLRLELEENLWNCRVDPVQAEMALLNLVANARDATGGQGEVTISTRNAVLPQDAPELRLDAGEYIVVCVSDDGPGIPDDIVDRVFDPFFTTKEIGKGTGLGLAMVYGFMRQSNGIARIDRSKKGGAQFELWFPRATGMVERRPVATGSGVTGGAERILMVEDQIEVGELGRAMLQDLGYDVVLATNARAALDVLSRDPNFALLFTDILMPGGMNGVALAQAVQRDYPHTAVLLTTGFADQAIDASARSYELIRKPYRRPELQEKLRQVLDRPGART